MPYGFVSLLTDYGLADGFVAACHGVLATSAPHVRVLDVTHLVPAQDVRRGSVVLAQTVPYLPPAVHVAVVDPGVGTDRRAIVVMAGPSLLVGPDNGLLLAAAEALGGPVAAYELADPSLRSRQLSATFHGRDLFIPAAARFATGFEPVAAGPAVPVAGLVRLPAPHCWVRPGLAEVEALAVDGFGNVQLALPADRLAGAGFGVGDRVLVSVSGRDAAPVAVPVVPTFASVPPGEPLLFADSAGMLALAVNRGSAARRFEVGAGARVRLRAPARDQ